MPTVVLVDPAFLNTAAGSHVLRALGSLEAEETWRTVTVLQDQKLFTIVDSLYRFNDLQAVARDVLVDLIVSGNGLPDRHTLRAGDSLRVPHLPVRPSQYARAGTYQGVHPEDRTLAAFSFDPGNDVQIGLDSLWQGRTWMKETTGMGTINFLSELGASGVLSEVGRSFYVGPPPAEAITVVPLPIGIGGGAHVLPVSEPLAAAAALDPAFGDTLYLLDFFDREQPSVPSHGDKVLEVARLALDRYGAPQLKGLIRPVELSFFPRVAEARREIDDYLAKYTSAQVRDALAAGLAARIANPPADTVDNRHTIPVLLLTAVLGNRIRGGTRAIISSSFFTTADLTAVIPSHYLSESTEMLFSAVRNDTGEWIEHNTHAQPQRAYFELRGEHGTVLIGAQRTPGSYFGEASLEGDGVTSLGPGLGWSGSVINPADSGTSFATPAIAAAMLTARTYWAQMGVEVSPREAVRRLILSAEVDPALVGRFASGGLPNIAHLLKPTGTYAVTTEGEVRLVTLRSSSVHLRVGAQMARQELARYAIRGLTVIDGEAFVFPAVLQQDRRRQWVRAQVEALEIRVQVGGEELTIRTLEEFSNHFKKVMVL